MDLLLRNDFISYLQSKDPRIVPVRNIRMEIIADQDFDIKDKEAYIKQPLGSGSVSYHNPSQKEIAVIDYEWFLNEQPVEVIKKLELKKPDFIVYDKSGQTCFIINELSQGDPDSKRNKAIKQMNDAVKHFNNVAAIRRFIEGFQKRACVFSAKKPPKTPGDIAKAFMMIHELLPEPITHTFGLITKLGYELIETSYVCIN